MTHQHEHTIKHTIDIMNVSIHEEYQWEIRINEPAFGLLDLAKRQTLLRLGFARMFAIFREHWAIMGCYIRTHNKSHFPI